MQTLAGTSGGMTRGNQPFRLLAGIGAVAPVVLLVVAAAASLAYALTFLRPATSWLDGYLPLDPASSQPLAAVMWSIVLASLAVGLVRGRSMAWWLVMVVLSLGLIAQSQALSHPVGTLVIGCLLALLLADRGRYQVETAAGWRRVTVAMLVVGALVVALETSLVIAATGSWPRGLGAVGDLTAALANALGMSDSTADRVLHQTSRDMLVILLVVASRLPILLAALGVLSRAAEPVPDPTIRARNLAIVRRYGSGALLPFQLGDDKHVFSSPDADGLVVYGLAGRTAVVLGDPIGSPDALPIVLDEFLERCRKLDRWPVVYQATAGCRGLLTAAGFRMFKVGEEAIVDLSTWNLVGHRRANLRHTITRCRKDSVTFSWYPNGIPAAETGLLDEMTAIDAAWRKGMGPQMGFTISCFDPKSTGDLPASVALSAAGRVLGFATFRPTGADCGYVLDLMRRAADGPPGVVEACISEAACALGAAGAITLSLGMAPLVGLDGVNGPWEERVLAGAVRLVHRWYDVDGLAFFKRKFDPYWIPRYGATQRRRDIVGFAVSLLRVHLSGAFRLPWRRRPARPAAMA